MLDNKKSLKDYKVQEGDVIMMDRIRANPNAAAALAAVARSAGLGGAGGAGGAPGGGFNFDF